MKPLPIFYFLVVPFILFIMLLILSAILVLTRTDVPDEIAQIVPDPPRPRRRREDFCVSGACNYGINNEGISTVCDANRKDFTLGYIDQPEECPRMVSPRETYWYYPNIFDRSSTDDNSQQITSCGSGKCEPALSDCPVFPCPPYSPQDPDDYSIPDPF